MKSNTRRQQGSNGARASRRGCRKINRRRGLPASNPRGRGTPFCWAPSHDPEQSGSASTQRKHILQRAQARLAARSPRCRIHNWNRPPADMRQHRYSDREGPESHSRTRYDSTGGLRDCRVLASRQQRDQVPFPAQWSVLHNCRHWAAACPVAASYPREAFAQLFPMLRCCLIPARDPFCRG